ncbi:MAG: hypothetical protein EP346_03505 [Bacteroidetes bacterium]|nr:MAG: hypothetical protein EP346_03505 [Bacteroidota bacterium]
MKNSVALIVLVALIMLDMFLTISNVHAVFDAKQHLPLFIISRVGILAVGIYIMRAQKNWLFLMATVGYLIFSFAALSILHFSYMSENI